MLILTSRNTVQLMYQRSCFKHNHVMSTASYQLKFSITFLIIISLLKETFTNLDCSVESPVVPKYYIMEKCHRSKLGIAARAMYSSLISCQRLGIEKKALALNFSPPDLNITEPLEYSCEVLTCAEADGGLSLSNDTRYDYYSIYAKPFPSVNSTCVPGTGMFHITDTNLNYIQAAEDCRNKSGVLADVTSEQRTDALAQMLLGAKVDSAFTGLQRRYKKIFYSTNGDSLDCTTYRAWAPGHPKQNANLSCVVITRQRTWKTMNCNHRYPALCELIPEGPYKKGSIFASRGNANVNGTDSQQNSTLV